MKGSTFDALACKAALGLERFAAFDHPTRRFIAKAMDFMPGLAPPVWEQELTGNQPVPYLVCDQECEERLTA